MELPLITNYGPPNSANTVAVTIGKITCYFSYQTLIGLYSRQTGMILSENLWGPTTAKHLNMISRTANRLNRAAFEKLVNEVCQ